MRGADMLKIVLVHVALHRDAARDQLLVVLRSWQRRQDEELQAIDRQFTFDDLDVVLDRGNGVLGKAQDVAAESDDPSGAPGLQHLPVLADLVLPLLGVQQVAGIDRLQPNEDPRAAGTTAFFDEVRDAVGERVNLDQEAELRTLALAQRNDAVEDLLPVRLRAKSSSVMKNRVTPFSRCARSSRSTSSAVR